MFVKDVACILFFLFVVECVSSAKLPDYVKTCSRNAPDFNKCATENGRLVIPYMLKGDKTFKIPPLVPLKIPKVELQAGRGLHLKIHDATVYGLDTAYLKKLAVDFNAKTINAALHFDRISINGEYEVDGRLLAFRLQGRGPLNITIGDVSVDYDITYGLIKKNGQDYITINSDHLTLHSEQQYYRLDNLFGNQQISDETNRVLNENARDVSRELNGPVTEIIKAVVNELVKNYITGVPIDDLFPRN